jgi:hypothetical protein
LLDRRPFGFASLARVAWFTVATLVLVLIAAAVVGHWRERALYKQLAEHNQRDIAEHRSMGSAPMKPIPPVGSGF